MSVLRLVVSLIFVTFYLSTVGILTVNMNCHFFDPDPNMRYHMEEFPEYSECSYVFSVFVMWDG